MNRRSFLQAIALAIAAPSVALAAQSAPVKALKRATPSFDPAHEYGNSIVIHGAPSPEMVEESVRILRFDARKALPPGTPFTLIDGGERDFGHSQRYAWFYSPDADRMDDAHWLRVRGMVVIGRGVA